MASPTARKAFITLTATLLFCGLGCGKTDATSRSDAKAPAVSKPASKPDVGTAVTESLSKAPTATTPVAFEWTAEPKLSDIPSGPIRGMVNGEIFEAKWVVFQPGTQRTWRVIIAVAEPLGGTLGVFFKKDTPYATIFLSDPPTAGKRYERAMAPEEKGYIHLRKTKEAVELTNWKSECAWAIHVSDWEVKDWSPEGEMCQVAGKASGKLVLTCKAKDGVQESFFAGEFRDAPVRYMGVPWWIDEETQKKFIYRGPPK